MFLAVYDTNNSDIQLEIDLKKFLTGKIEGQTTGQNQHRPWSIQTNARSNIFYFLYFLTFNTRLLA